MRRLLLLLALLCALCGAERAAAQYYTWGSDPPQKWSAIRTPDVRMIYPDTVAGIARRTLFYIRSVRPDIGYGFRHGPMRIPFVMHPENFQSNGLVMYLPKRVEFLTSPAVDSYSMPWYKQLVAHEYRHAVQYNNLDRGVIRALSYVLGQQGSTIGLLCMPIWAMEGDAVMSETMHSSFGRGLQPSFSMAYRAMGSVGRDRRNIDRWFCGSYRDYIPDHYELGYQICSYAWERYGENIWDKVAWYGSRNPYVLATTRVALGKFYKTNVIKLFRETFDELERYWDSLPETGDSAVPLTALPEKNHTTYQWPLPLGDTAVTLLDTPGHVDFSAEMERTLQVLDYAVLVISGTDGVQAHTETLWQLLRRYRVPVFVFVTKMDLPGADRAALMADLRAHLSGACVDFTDPDPEQIALCDEAALEQYLDTGALPDETVRALIRSRKLFPCLFGSGLKLTGVDAFLAALERYAAPPEYPAEFGARVFKIMRDAQGNRLTCLKVTGGQLRVRAPLTYFPRGADAPVQEKVNAIRLYSGEKFESAETVPAGGVCAVQGLTQTYPGQGLGSAAASMPPSLEPVLTYRIGLPPDVDARAFLPRLRQLEEEDPQLHIVWDETLREIHVQLMGTVQIEVLKSLIRERFDVDVQVDSGRILYQETIAAPVEGVGHFEPLRHYAEVHLLLEPAERGTGLTFDAACSEDVLDRNWQRLILTHLAEKCHRGVLTGAPLTDVKITLLAGRAHVKHTEGGDFRQATWRAVRQGLMQAESVLLEPYYAFRIEVPAEQIGRAISDVRLMSGTFSSPETHGDMAVLTGRAPVATMRDYPAEVAAYTRGRGRISCSVAGYDTCHNAQEVIAESGYDPTRDLDNTPDSVFCAHGAGTVIPWDRVRDYMHIDTGFGKAETQTPPPAPRMFRRRFDLDDRELEEILQREFGPIRRSQYAAPVRNAAPGADETERAELFHPRRERVIVDGYNVIFAWDELRALADSGHIDAARERLMDALSNYAAFTRREVVVVFDGYRVPGGQGEKFDRSGLHVVFTRQGETADAYMEKLADEIGKNESVRVVTSDALIQLTALRAGVLRMSAREFRQELAQVAQQLEAAIRDINGR